MNKKIFFFDIDGTLLYQHQVSSRVIKAIQDTQKNGDLCFIASGRPACFIPENIRNIGFDGYVLFNGAYVTYKEEVIASNTLDFDDLKILLQFLKDNNCEYVLQTNNQSFLDRSFKRLLSFFINNKIDPEQFVYHFVEDEIMKETIKVEVWPDNNKISQILINKFKQYTWHQYELTNMELQSNTISKAWGIQKVIDYLDTAPENTYCFGDDFNDIEMFKTVCHSYAMNNAANEVKQAAKKVCPSVQEDGVAIILENIIHNNKDPLHDSLLTFEHS